MDRIVRKIIKKLKKYPYNTEFTFGQLLKPSWYYDLKYDALEQGIIASHVKDECENLDFNIIPADDSFGGLTFKKKRLKVYKNSCK